MSDTPVPKTKVPDDSATAQDLDDLTERVLGEFRLLRRLGHGGMADVYLAEQISLSRYVAVKILRSDAIAGQNKVFLKRFQQEAQAAGGLSHPNIVAVYTIGQEGPINYIVQEYVQGDNLGHSIKRNGSPDFATGIRMMKDVAAALSAAAKAGIIHRDIKPENILLTTDGQAKVADFGLARLQDQKDDLSLTRAGTTLGTPLYMSPEQIQGHKLDHRCDLYSFGVTFYHVFAGRPPYTGSNDMSVAVLHLKEAVPDLGELRADLPRSLCDLIRQLMAKSPNDRPQSADEVLARLVTIEASPGPLCGEHRLSSLSRAGTRATLKNILPYLAGSVLMFVAAFAIVYVTRQTTRVPEPDWSYPVEDTAAEQFASAMLQRENPEAWETVIREFPGTQHAEMAQFQLGLLMLEQNLLERAEMYFRAIERIGVSRSDDFLRVAGLAGQAIVATRQDRHAAAIRISTQQIGEDSRFLTDNQRLRDLYESAVRASQRAVEREKLQAETLPDPTEQPNEHSEANTGSDPVDDT